MSIEVLGQHAAQSHVLTPEALGFIATLHHQFNSRRLELLQSRFERGARILAGEAPTFRPETAKVREGSWRVASAPGDLESRLVEITGPVERKMIINALNSGADVFMADLEDSLTPRWDKVIDGHVNLMDAVRRKVRFDDTDRGKTYTLDSQVATLVVRPRGWHLVEKHVEIDSEPVSASLFDFGLYLFHNGRELLDRGSGPYFYLPKLEGHEEARLWNDVFVAAQEALAIPRGSIRATVLIETILAAFEMDEILYELREHASGLNAGRWDYIFSLIKKFGAREEFVLPDRSQVTMTAPFMKAYAELLVRTCHVRGAHAIGGMAAYIPNRHDQEANAIAMEMVRADKAREASQGFDGTWVAHPDLVSVAREEFASVLGDQAHQKHVTRDDLLVEGSALIDVHVPGGSITEAGMRNNISVALQYLDSWLRGTGAVAIFDLMEDAATAEISRAQLWQWMRAGVRLADGRLVNQALYQQLKAQESVSLESEGRTPSLAAVRLLDNLVLSEAFMDSLTVPAYELLESQDTSHGHGAV